jgi:hypothetical protein
MSEWHFSPSPSSRTSSVEQRRGPTASIATRVRRAALTAAMFGVLGVLLYAKAIPCAFARVFHLPCPACGSTRAVLALVSGDLHGVLRYNPLGPVVLLILGVLAAESLVSVLVHGDFRDAGEGLVGRVMKRAIVVVAVLEAALWIARFFGVLGGPVPVG